jgi:hypothetical protein
LSVSSSPLWSSSSTSVCCCTMRSKLGCRALLLKFVKAKMEASCAGVAPTLMADGGRVPCAGDSEPRDEKVRSPKPLSSSACAASSCASSVGNCASDGIRAEGDACLADVLVLRALLDVLDAGVRFLVNATGTSSAVGSAPVIIRSASLTGSGVFSHGFLRRDRVIVVVLVTKPSLSSLETFNVWLASAGFVAMGFAASLRGAALVTRVVVVAVVDVILVLLGRGIVAINSHWNKSFCRVVRSKRAWWCEMGDAEACSWSGRW